MFNLNGSAETQIFKKPIYMEAEKNSRQIF